MCLQASLEGKRVHGFVWGVSKNKLKSFRIFYTSSLVGVVKIIKIYMGGRYHIGPPCVFLRRRRKGYTMPGPPGGYAPMWKICFGVCGACRCVGAGIPEEGYLPYILYNTSGVNRRYVAESRHIRRRGKPPLLLCDPCWYKMKIHLCVNIGARRRESPMTRGGELPLPFLLCK